MEAQFTINSIIIIVVLIFPGVVFKRFYYQGQFTKQFGAGLFADRLITNFFWGIFVQALTFMIYSRSVGFTYTSIKTHIDGYYNTILQNHIPNLSYIQIKYILGYLISLILIAAASGSIFHFLIRRLRLDVHFNVFRFANKWNYIIRGDSPDLRDIKQGKVLTTMADIVIDDGTEKHRMVQGFINDYDISEKTGEIQTIYLTAAKKFSSSDNSFKDIPGDFLVIPCERIINMNIRYNIRAVNSQNANKTLKILIDFILIAGLVALAIYPWFLDVRLINKLLFIITSFVSFTAILLMFSWLLKTVDEPTNKKSSYLITCITIILFAFIALMLVHKLPFLAY